MFANVYAISSRLQRMG